MIRAHPQHLRHYRTDESNCDKSQLNAVHGILSHRNIQLTNKKTSQRPDDNLCLTVAQAG
jgi:hypothetical protein